jgi:hypothetical protein
LAVEKWIAGSGQGLTWGNAFATAGSTEINQSSFLNGDSVLSSIVVANGSALDIFADLSMSLASITTVAPNYVGFYIYPLNEDGTSYGDGKLSTTLAAVVPEPQYWVGNIVIPVGTQVCTGMLQRIVLPPGSFCFAFYNQTGATLATTSNVVKYRTYNRSIA